MTTLPVNAVMQKGIFFNTRRVAIISSKPLCKITADHFRVTAETIFSNDTTMLKMIKKYNVAIRK